jgi:ParB-like nuclease domain
VSTDVRLPIQDIRNSNPVWLRSADNLQPLDALAKSIQRHGMLLPVLVRPDFVMLDGARRLLAAEKLGWTEVPVIVANSWTIVLRYYEQLNKIESETPGSFNKQLRWSELDELWSVLLKPIQHDQRMAQAVNERRRRARLRQQGLPEKDVRHNDSDNAYTGYVKDLADMFQIRPIHVKLVRDIFHSHRELKSMPGFEGPFARLLQMAEGLGIQTSSTMRQFTRNIRGGMPIKEATERAEHSLNNSFKAPWRRALRPEDASNREAPEGLVHTPISEDKVQALTKLIDQLSMESARFHVFEADITLDVAKQISSTIRTAVNRINAMRRRLETHGEAPQGERSK